MKKFIGENIRKARIKKGMSQHQLAENLMVDRSTVANWETGRREPDVTTLNRLTTVLDVTFTTLLENNHNTEKPLVIMVDDESIILNGGTPILKSVMPNAEIIGFTKPSEAIEFAKRHRVYLAILDIEMGRISGLDLCRELLKINSNTNVIYLTAYKEYSFDAWATGASGFLLKPLAADEVKDALTKLRYPLNGGDSA